MRRGKGQGKGPAARTVAPSGMWLEAVARPRAENQGWELGECMWKGVGRKGSDRWQSGMGLQPQTCSEGHGKAKSGAGSWERACGDLTLMALGRVYMACTWAIVLLMSWVLHLLYLFILSCVESPRN